MTIEIIEIDDRNYKINGKRVFKDTNDEWVATVKMTTEEIAYFQGYIHALETKDSKQHLPDAYDTLTGDFKPH